MSPTVGKPSPDRLWSIRPAAFVVVAALAVGCGGAATANHPGAAPPRSTPAGVSLGRWIGPAVSARTGCHAVNGLPDGRCTPGATDPAVTETDIDSTICVAGYSAKVRPPGSITEPIKRSEMGAYGLSEPLALVELDHLVPLSIGGAPAAVANLWPQDRRVFPGAGVKDQLENFLHHEVCSGKVALAAAQQAIATDWVAAYCAARLSECSDGRHLVQSVVRPGSSEPG